jgi:outer membrane protein TolC
VANEHLIQQSMTLLDSIGKISQTRYANGIGAQQDVIQAQVEKTLLQSELLAVQSEQHHTHIRLNTLLARPVNAPLAEPAELRVIPDSSVLDEAALLERLRANNPQLRAATANSQASEKNRELVRLNRYPDFTLGVAPTLIGGATKSWDAMIEVTIPLQQSARRAQEREAEAMLVAANARQEALLNQVQAELSENLSELEALRRTETLITGRLLPQAELSYQAALAAYETGKAGFTALMEAQRQALKVRQQKLQAQADMQLRLVEIEKLLGASL